MTSTEINLEQCSIDYQFQVQQQQRRLTRVADWAIAAFTLGCAAVVMVQPLNNAARSAIGSLPGAQPATTRNGKANSNASVGEKVGALNKLISLDFREAPKLGEAIVGYEVTSLFGKRSRPCPTCSDFHRGVDLATPVGTVIYAIGSPGSTVKVECKQDLGGGGLYSVQTTPEFPGLSFEALHLSNCAEGNQPAGSVIARSGNSGTGTGPHLHFQVRKRSQRSNPDGGLYPFEKFWLFWAVQGNPPRVAARTIGGSQVKLSTAVSYGAIAALGCFAVFPPTVAAVKQATGVNIDPTGLFGSVDSVGSVAICNAEGNCNGTEKTDSYQGHIDPGNGARNQGMFSWQAGGCSTPQECDRRGLDRLQTFVPKLQQKAVQQGLKLDAETMVNGADLVIQAPLAADDYIARLKQCQQQGKVGSDAVLCARVESFKNPATGKLETTFSSQQQLAQDQARRMGEIARTLKGN